MMTCIQGDALTVLRTFPDEQFHCCVTSPPYWGLRDYGMASQIGLERTPEEYVARIVEVLREVRRVLRADGTCWVNLGDSYCSTDKWGGGKSGNTGKHTVSDDGDVPSWTVRTKKPEIPGVKPKDLIGIPWRVAFALQANGWYLRSDIIWAKPNPMPESVTDRPTKSHEYLFLLAKSEKYYYNAEAIAEPVTCFRIRGPAEHPDKVSTNGNSGLCRANYLTSGKWSREQSQSSSRRMVEGVKAARAAGADHDNPFGPMRNKRSVWTIPTQSYPGAHFATFPEDLVRPCILAGCPQGGTVLDPFAGSGTTLLVAQELGSSAVGIDLNPAYVALAERRIAQEVLLFAAADTLLEEEATPPPEPEQLSFDEEAAP